MTKKLSLATGLVVLTATMSVVVPATADEPIGFDRLSNSDAAGGSTAGWQDSGFAAVQFGSSPAVPSTSPYAAQEMGPLWLFQATETGATMSQEADLSDVTSTVDTGEQEVGVTALLGGSGSGDDGVELVAQPEDASGQPLGSPVTLGPPTAADRGNAATMVSCLAVFTAPVDTRSVQVTLTATGVPGQPSTGTATDIGVAAPLVEAQAQGVSGPAQGQNCYILAPTMPGNPSGMLPTTTGTMSVITTPAPPISTPTPTTITTATPQPVTVTSATVRAALKRILTTGNVSVATVEHAHGYEINASVPAAGTLYLEWFAAIDGVQRLVGQATHNYLKAARVRVKLTLNNTGMKLLRSSRKDFKLSERASFTPLHAQKITLRRTIRVRS